MKNANSKKSRFGRGAKIAGAIAALTIVIVTIVALALPGAATFNETAYNKMPTWLPGGGTIVSATPIVDFDTVTVKDTDGIVVDSGSTIDADKAGQKEWPEAGNNMHWVTYQNKTVDSTKFNGVLFDKDGNISHKIPSYNGQASINLKNPVTYDAEVDGFMFYYDVSETTTYTLKDGSGNTVKNKDGGACTYSYVDLSLAMTVGGNLVRPVSGVNFDAYYCEDGKGNWMSIKGVSGNRVQVPVGTKGWIYIPAEAMWTYYSTFPSKNISELAGKTITKVQFYASGYTIPGKTLYFDSVYAVKRNDDPNLPTTAPNGALNNLTGFSFDVAEGFGKYTEIDAFEGANYATYTHENGVLKLQYVYNSAVNSGAELKCERGEVRLTYNKNANNINGGESVLKFDKGTDGVMYYVDASNVKANNGKCNGNIAFEICLANVRYGNDYRDTAGGFFRASKGTGYAYDVESGTWSQVNATDAGRMEVPVGFNGYIYVPFNQFKNDVGTLLSSIVENYNVYVPNVNLYTAGVDVTETSAPYVIFDNIGGVKFHDTYAKSAAPATLPNGQGIAANPVTVLDFESEAYGNTSNGAFANVQVRSDLNVSAYGNNNKALIFSNIRVTNPEQTIYRAKDDTVSAAGATGLMFYLNLTDLKGGQSAYYNEYTNIQDGTSETSFLAFGLRIFSEKGQHDCSNNAAYYYTDGQWYKTNAVNGNRILFPEGFEGYVYVPFSSYGNSLSAATKVTGIFPLTTGIINNRAVNAVNEIILDDVQFVTATGTAADNADSVPAMPQYIVGGATGLTEFTTEAFINFEGNQSVYNASAVFTSDFQSWKGLDMILKTDAAKNDTELVLDLSTNAGQGYFSFKTQPVIKANSAMKGSGVMLHIDISGMTSDKSAAATANYTYDGIGYSVKNGIGIGFNFKASDGNTYSTGSWAADRTVGYGVDHVPVFYSADGADGWMVTTNTNNSRVIFPEGFSGWVYIPWTSLTKNNNPDTDIVTATASAKSLTLQNILIYTSGNIPTKTEAAQIVFDDFMTVNFTTALALDTNDYDEEVAAAIAENMAMRDGANIRVGANGTGIRFFTDVTKTGDYAEYFPTDYLTDCDTSAIRFGTLIVPTDLKNGNLTRSNAEVVDIPVRKVWSENDDAMTYTAVIQNIPFSWYNENLSAVSYVVYGDHYNPDGTVNGTYLYTDEVTSSYLSVAIKAYNEDKTNENLKKIANTPATLPNGNAIAAYKQLTDFDNNFESAPATATKGSSALAFDDVLGNSLKITHGSSTGTLEVTPITFEKGVNAKGYSGLIYYVDFRTASTGDVYKHAIPINVSAYVDGGGEIEVRSLVGGAYYYEDGKWIAVSADSGAYRMNLPNGFAGYVYVPFTSYCQNNSAKTSWDDTIKSKPYITLIRSYCNNINSDGKGEMILDNFYIVK